jgi:uncharacterized glyoxalase superfamily protein PhnB
MLNKLTPNIMVDDVNHTVSFYCDNLDFTFILGVKENSQEVLTSMPVNIALDFAMVKCENVEMMFQAKRSLIKEIPEFNSRDIGGTLTFYIEVEDVKGLYEKLKDKIPIVKDLHTTFYGMQEFYIRDCNNYILTFAEQLNTDHM